MIFISHRRNAVDQLLSTPSGYGVEVDIRSNNGELIIHHDAFSQGVSFSSWLDAYAHRFLIANVKEEGLEARLLSEFQSRGITDYFLLDQSFPFLVKWCNALSGRSAIRVSEYESIDTVINLKGMVRWVWVDCFSTFPLTGEQARFLKEIGFNLCLVAPELQGRSSEGDRSDFMESILASGVAYDAVCTKHPDEWAANFA